MSGRMLRPCRGRCGRHIPAGQTFCPDCGSRDQERRRSMHRSHWRRLRTERLALDQHTCQSCGQPANTVHLRPELHGNHDAATPDDCITLCRSCHGTVDAPRAGWGKPPGVEFPK